MQEVFAQLPPGAEEATRGPRLNVEQYVPHMDTYEEAVHRLNTFFAPKQNKSYERHLFHKMKQGTEENIGVFAMRLRAQADKCKFTGGPDEHFKDQVILTYNSGDLRNELLKQGDVTLEQILRVANIFETVAKQEKTISSERHDQTTDGEGTSNTVNRIEAKARETKPKWQTPNQSIDCGRCGYKGHKASDEKCPAKGKTCIKCGGRDHFSKRCRSKKRSWNNPVKPSNESNVTKKDDTDDEPGDKKPKTDTVQNISEEDTRYVFQITSSGK